MYQTVFIVPPITHWAAFKGSDVAPVQVLKPVVVPPRETKTAPHGKSFGGAHAL